MGGSGKDEGVWPLESKKLVECTTIQEVVKTLLCLTNVDVASPKLGTKMPNIKAVSQS